MIEARTIAEAANHAATHRPVEPARTVRSDDLFAGKNLLLIEHRGQQYRLLITRNDRLILQK